MPLCQSGNTTLGISLPLHAGLQPHTLQLLVAQLCPVPTEILGKVDIVPVAVLFPETFLRNSTQRKHNVGMEIAVFARVRLWVMDADIGDHALIYQRLK